MRVVTPYGSEVDSDFLIELIGYLASALIVLSITQKSILRLRVLGFAGGVVFLAYALAIEAYPIAVVNLIGASIHAWYLRKLVRRKDEVFRILRVRSDSRYLLDFLDFYGDEIQGVYQPEFVYQPSERQVSAFVLRDMVPAGLFIGEQHSDGTFEVLLDFVIPQYRDFKIGRYVYSDDSELFAGLAPRCAFAVASNDEHARYLKRMGFVEDPATPGRYEIQLRHPANAGAPT